MMWGWVLVVVLVVLGWLWWELVMALHSPTVGDVSVLDEWDGVGDDA